jgi:hypothetical protein
MVRVFASDNIGQHMVEHAVIRNFQALIIGIVWLIPTPINPTLLHFIISAP